MNTRAITNVLAILCIAAGILVALWSVPGCQWVKEIDEAIWSPPAAVDGGDPPEVPPLAEYIAAVLALLGFGGMSAWIRRANSNSKKTSADLLTRIVRLEKFLAKDEQ